MTNDFILPQLTKEKSYARTVSVSEETYSKLMEIKQDSGLSLRQIVALMVDYCNDRLVIK